jgi:hypothetical protein
MLRKIVFRIANQAGKARTVVMLARKRVEEDNWAILVSDEAMQDLGTRYPGWISVEDIEE